MISIILLFIAGIFNACMDVLKTRYNTSIFLKCKNQQWINPSISWKNKWKFKTKFGILIMSTFLVWLTDFWHFCKSLMLLCIMFAIIFYQPIFVWWIDIFLLHFAFSGAFELFYSKILIKRK